MNALTSMSHSDASGLIRPIDISSTSILKRLQAGDMPTYRKVSSIQSWVKNYLTHPITTANIDS